MADEQIVFNVVADYDKAIKEWEQLRDAVATTTKEYTEANQEIEKLRIAKGEFTGVAYKSKRAIEQEKQALRQSNLEYKRREKELNEVFKAQEQNTSSVKKLTKVQIQQKDATGATTSAALELGRVVSDAPYGIRGMANNLTQLVSQMAFATKAAGGFRLALKGLWTSLMGPLGVVLAITTVISAFDFLYGANKKTETSTSDLKQEFEGFAEVLRNDVNASIEDYIELIKNKNKLDKTVNKASERYLEIEEEIASAKKNRAILEDFQAKQIALHGKASEITARDIIKLTKRENDLLAERKKLFLETGESINKLKEANDKYKESTKEEKQEETVVRGSVKWYKKLISARKQDRDDFSTTSKEYEKYTIEIEEYQKRLDKLTGETDPKSKVSVLGLNMIDPKKEVAKAKKRLEIFKKFATKSLFPDGKFIDFSKDPKTKLILFGEPTEEDLEEFKLSLDQYVDIYKDVVGGISEFLGAEFDREITIEQNKTNALNAELNNRLLNEKLSADQRKSIQNQIWQNDEALRKKQDEIAKKKFNTEKAFNISMAVVETYAGATKALNDPSVPSTIARFALAGATIAKGLLSVATISRQKFQSSSAATPINTASGGGGGGVGDRSFDFNLVGNTQENQLANAIQSQFSTPLQAFVVSKDITTQQELDLNIKSSATF